MAKHIFECDPQEWVKQAQKINPLAPPGFVNIHQNTFSSLQFIDEEIINFQNLKTYCLQENEINKAWVCAYHLSPEVIRLRGLITLHEHRSFGHMTDLLTKVIENYSDQAKRALSFSKTDALGFYLKFGFKIVSDFAPRPIEMYDPRTGKYYCDDQEILTLVEYTI